MQVKSYFTAAGKYAALFELPTKLAGQGLNG